MSSADAIQETPKEVFRCNQMIAVALLGGALGLGVAFYLTLRRLGESALAIRMAGWWLMIAVGEWLLFSAEPLSTPALFLLNAALAKLFYDRWVASAAWSYGGNSASFGLLITASLTPNVVLAAPFVLFFYWTL